MPILQLIIQKIDAKAGDKVSLTAICIVDGDKVEADPAKAAKTAVKAEVLEQHKGDKQVVFKFKRRKNYKVKKGHRQNLTKIRIVEIGTAKYDPKKAAKPVAKKAEAKKPVAKPAQNKASEKKPTQAKAPAAKKPAEKKPAEKKATTEKKAPAKKPAAKK